MRGPLVIAALMLGMLSDPSATLRRITDTESYEVYGTVLKLQAEELSKADARPEYSIGGSGETYPLLIGEETTTVEDCLSSGEMIPPEWQDVWASYVVNNREPSRLVAGALSLTHVLLSSDFVQRMTRTADGVLTFPTADGEARTYFRVSAVGVDPQKRRAMVYCPSLWRFVRRGATLAVGKAWCRVGAVSDEAKLHVDGRVTPHGATRCSGSYRSETLQPWPIGAAVKDFGAEAHTLVTLKLNLSEREARAATGLSAAAKRSFV